MLKKGNLKTVLGDKDISEGCLQVYQVNKRDKKLKFTNLSLRKINLRKNLSKLAAIISFATFLIIVFYILIKGVVNLNPSLFEMKYTTENVSMMPAIITTLYLVVLGLLLSVPVGLFTAIFMAEYLDLENRFVKIIRLATDTLSAIPSIVYGLFGMLFFVYFLNLKNSILSGALTVSIMVLPVIIRSSEEAFLNISKDYRLASYALGAGKIRTVFKVLLPVALPSILSGVILSMGRIIGESAALIYTMGSSSNLPHSIFQPGRSLAVHMYILSGEGLYLDQAFATAVVILFIVLVLNAITTFLANKIANKSLGLK